MKAASYHHSGIAILRPILGVSKSSVLATCRQNNWFWVEDSSNRSLKYTRNSLRHTLAHEVPATLPLLAELFKTAKIISQSIEEKSFLLLSSISMIWECGAFTMTRKEFASWSQDQRISQVYALKQALQWISREPHSVKLQACEDLLRFMENLLPGKCFSIGGCLVQQSKEGFTFLRSFEDVKPVLFEQSEILEFDKRWRVRFSATTGKPIELQYCNQSLWPLLKRNPLFSSILQSSSLPPILLRCLLVIRVKETQEILGLPQLGVHSPGVSSVCTYVWR